MAIRKTTHVLKNSSIVNRPLPSTLLQGEPIVNTAEGILYFSGMTMSTAEWTPAGTGNTANFFEVGSNLYDLKLRNQITKYQGQSGSGLAGKFLSGTTSGFVLADISTIASSVDSYTTGATWSPNTLTISLNNGKPNVPVTIDSFNGLTLYGSNTVNGDLTVTGTTTLNGPSYYNNSASASNEIVNYGTLTSYTQNIDVYVTGNTLTPSTNYTATQSAQLNYHGTPIGGPYFIVTENTFTTGGTYNNSSKLITFTKNDTTNYTVDLSSIDVNDTYVTGGTTSGSSNFSESATISLKYNRDIADGTYSLPYEDTFVTGGTTSYSGPNGTISLNKNDGTTASVAGLSNIYTTGFTYNSSTNTFTITDNNNSSYSASINAVSGLTISNLTAGRVVYVGTSGLLKDESGFEYNDGTNLLTVGNINVQNSSGTVANIGQGGLVVGSGGSISTPGIGDLTVHGNLMVFGTATTVSTNELYVEDPQVTLNYNPTGDTSSTSVSSGIKVQAGNGTSTGDTYFTIGQMQNLTGIIVGENPNVSEYTGLTGYLNRGWVTQLNDIVIRNTNKNEGSPNGVRVLAEFDVLDGGTY